MNEKNGRSRQRQRARNDYGYHGAQALKEARTEVASTPADKARWERYAAQMGVSLSCWARQILNASVDSELNG